MDAMLKRDIDRFCNIYLSNVGESIKQILPESASSRVEQEISDEFDLFRASLLNRLEQEFRR